MKDGKFKGGQKTAHCELFSSLMKKKEGGGVRDQSKGETEEVRWQRRSYSAVGDTASGN